MKISQPKPFLFERGKRAVLFLHGFTGNSADCRMMARFLEKKVILVMDRNIRGMVFRQKNLSILDQMIGGRTSWKDIIF